MHSLRKISDSPVRLACSCSIFSGQKLFPSEILRGRPQNTKKYLEKSGQIFGFFLKSKLFGFFQILRSGIEAKGPMELWVNIEVAEIYSFFLVYDDIFLKSETFGIKLNANPNLSEMGKGAKEGPCGPSGSWWWGIFGILLNTVPTVSETANGPKEWPCGPSGTWWCYAIPKIFRSLPRISYTYRQLMNFSKYLLNVLESGKKPNVEYCGVSGKLWNSAGLETKHEKVLADTPRKCEKEGIYLRQ